MNYFVADHLKNLLKCLAFTMIFVPVLFPAGGFAASIDWQTLQGRERITITKSTSEGMGGNIARIDANGIIIPFDHAPSGLVLSEQPQGASIVKGTAQYGQSLAILTQTPKFGFVVSRQTPTQIVIDFFPDELGARWQPGEGGQTLAQLSGAGSKQASGTEPSVPAVQPAAQPVQSDARSVSAPAVPSEATKNASSRPAAPADISPSSIGGSNAGSGKNTPIAWNSQPVATNPPVLTASGTKPAKNNAEPSSPVPAVTVPPEPQAPSKLPDGIFHDTRVDTAQRNASLPTPGLDNSLVPAESLQAGTQPADPVGQEPGATRQTVNTSKNTGQASVGGQPPILPSPAAQASAPRTSQQGRAALSAQPVQTVQPVQGSPASQQPSVSPVALPAVPHIPATQADGDGQGLSEAASPQLLQGLGVKIGPANYRGKYNPYGEEGVATIPEQNTGQTPVLTDGHPAGTASTVSSDAVSTGPGKPASPSGRVRMAASQAQTEEIPNAVQSKTVQPTDGQTGDNSGDMSANTPQSVPEAEGAVGAENTQAAAGADEGHTKSGNKDVPQVQASDGVDTPASVKENAENVIYVNEQGEEVVPPADPAARLSEIRQLVAGKKFAEAHDMVTALLEQTNLSKEQREDSLHIRAEMLFFLHRDNLAQYGQTIIEATDLAINANTRSSRNAVALLRLGYINLQQENIPEAEARFNMLRRMYPNDENVPLSYYYWGDYFYNHDDLQRAIDQFQVVTQKYPDSQYAREASLGLARSFYRLGYYEQAFSIVEYIEQRWPRFYLHYPPFLNMMGDVAFRLNNYDFATKYYWLYANLDPQGEEVDVILTRIGDIYSLQQQSVAAREVYNEAIDRFPDRHGGLIALMRLAEESINDDPTIAGMFDAFDSKPLLRPVDVYKKIINEHPQSNLVSLAQLKLAMWHLWNHDYVTTLDIADAFLRAKPEDDLAPKMKDVALKTFAVLASESVANGSFNRMRDVWERYPVLQEQEEILTPESRVALGISYWQDGRPDDALIAVEPFFLGNKIPGYSEMALTLVLSIYEQYDQWAAIEEVGKRVSLWEISDKNQLQLDYALALARENIGKPEEAAVLWQKLYDSKQLPDDQMVQAVYFLARDAEKRQKNDEAYLLGVEALKRLRAEAVRNPEAKSAEKIKTQISSLMSLTEEGGRLGESLEYADQYMQYLDENDPDRAAVLFRMARINKKQGNTGLWRERLNEIVRLYPDSVFGQTASAALKSTDIQKAATTYSP